MQNTRIFFLATVVVFLLSATAWAGDFATLNFIGFSSNGRYVAFEEYGMQDGSGFPYSNYYLIDTAKNSFAAGPFYVRIDKDYATEQQARSKAKLAAAASLRRFGIIQRNTGSLVVSRLLTDLSVNPPRGDGNPTTQKINFAEIVGSMYRQGDYDLMLGLIKVETKACDYSDYPIYKLQLSLKDNGNDKVIMLQKDGTLPRSRQCTIDYGIQYIHLYKDYIVVFLNYYTVGFEGPDMRYIAVTGKYK